MTIRVVRNCTGIYTGLGSGRDGLLGVSIGRGGGLV